MNNSRVLVSATDCSATETRPANNAAMGSLSQTLSGNQKDEDEFPMGAKTVNGLWFSVEVRKGIKLSLYKDTGQTVLDGGLGRKQSGRL